ncbi:MAG TPA: ATP-binding protein [Thermoanaerobaculia bacterium]|nr:ATP-binding protein [Thermoanaerobaculia bacterium]
MNRRLAELLMLAATLAAPNLPPPWSLLVLLILGALWLALRPPRREMVVAGFLLILATAALAALGLAASEARLTTRQWSEREAHTYGAVWGGLRHRAAAAAELLKRGPNSPLDALDLAGDRPQTAPRAARAAARGAFDRLRSLPAEPPETGRRRSLLLVDRDGNPVAWAGDGLIHEPDPWPRSGLAYQAGFNAVTLFAAEPLDDSARPWRVVAGASFATDALPQPPWTWEARAAAAAGGAAPALDLGQLLSRAAGRLRRSFAALHDALLPAPPLRWSLVDNQAQSHAGTLEIGLPGAPTLVVAKLGAPPSAERWAARLAWGLVAGVLLALAVMRGVGLALPGGATQSAPQEHRAWVAVPALSGVFAAGMAAAVPGIDLAALLGGLGIAAGGLSLTRRRLPLEEPAAALQGRDLPWIAALAGGVSLLALCGIAWAVERRWGPVDLAESLMVPLAGWCLRLAWSGAALGFLCLAGRQQEETTPSRDPWAWLAAALLLLAGAVAGGDLSQLWAAVALLAAGGASAAVFGDRQPRRQGMVLATLVVLAVLAASDAWEIAYRLRLADYASGELLARLAPPSPAEAEALRRGLRDHFAPLDVETVVPRSTAGLDRKDLAYSLWRHSPLARPNALSAVAVRAGNDLVSSFAFGMPLTPEGRLDEGRLRGVGLPGWELVEGEAEVRSAQARWGTIHYWLLPRPGFRVSDRRRLADIEVDLLRGGPTAGPIEELAAPALYALYAAPDGRAVISPWEERPPLAARLRRWQRGAAVVETPAGPARAYVLKQRDGRAWQVVYLPPEVTVAALERTANWGIGVLLLLAASTPPIALLALPRAAFRELLRRTLRSYSRRLLIVYTALLLLPLLLLNGLLVRSVENDMLRGQSTKGSAALRSAQQILAGAIRALPVGFVFDPGTFDPKLIAISEVVQHEVNLYGHSTLAASSRHELFTAGLLPKRIPGDVYSSLALRDRSLYSLTNYAANLPYLELYAPLRVSTDEPRVEPSLFLSVPLLAQQEEGARQLAHLRRHAILVTASLFLLLAAVGSRLARNFTRPIMQLVEGTRRIAAGARSLDLAPTELELAALVRAVDDMARSIAVGRERLLREKQVVERMVENITAGVVSLDRDRRVLMHNRVAAELLGLSVGQRLERVVERSERLAPVAAFLRRAGGEMARATVRLGGTAGGEREWSLVWVPLPGEGEPFALLVVEDATEELRGQRLLAWAQMARMIAHEIKNPLTPIRLSAEHMREVYREDPERFAEVFERCTANILTQVEELRSIASEFSTYSAIPRIDRRPGDLAAAIAELVEGYRAAPPTGVSVELELPAAPLAARFDAKLLSRAVRNLIENALRASAGGGKVVVRVERVDGIDGKMAQARIAVLDWGPGVRPELLPRIFDPYFSTHDTGTGLGLPIARRIAEEHGGEISAHNRPAGGLEAVITIPL